MSDAPIVVKLTTQHPSWPLVRQTPSGEGIWNRYHFLINQEVEACDYWVVCDGLLARDAVVCPRDNVLLVTWEPPAGVRGPYRRDFLAQFSGVLTCHRRLRHPSVELGQQGHPWFVGRSYDELVDASLPDKNRQLVVITSNKAFSPAHRARLEFAYQVRDYFGQDAMLVGRGISEFADKWDVLAPARYAVVMENGSFDDWVTEKLPDAYLAGAFPFYFGAPNIARYFPGDSVHAIDIQRPAEAIAAIELLMSREHHYEGAGPALLRARSHYLDRLQLFPMLADLLDRRRRRVGPGGRPQHVAIQPERTDVPLHRRLRSRLRQEMRR